MKRLLSYVIIVGGIIFSCYVGLWLMFISPIIDCCRAFDAGTLTALMIGIAILKCFFASTSGLMIAYIVVSIASYISKS